jgi:phosphate transport system permease protein
MRQDKLLVFLLRACACASGVIVLVILGFLLIESWPMLSGGLGRFFSDSGWHPSTGTPQFNLLPMLIGTLLVTALAVAIATPMGIASALFCHFYAPPLLAKGYRRLIELLAGIPSVVYGFWGLVVLVPIIARIQAPGPSLLAGVIILTIMILPTIALVADANFANLPDDYLKGAVALGLSRWGTIYGVVLPSAKSGLITGVILQTGRAIGETMAVLMVCGNVVRTPQSLFDPIRTLTANIALEMAYAMGDHRAALFVSGLLLMALVAALVLAAEALSRERNHV